MVSMSKNVSRYYWLCQIVGWCTLGLGIIVVNTTVVKPNLTTEAMYVFTAIFVILGVISTHIFREVIRRSGWLKLPVEKALPKFLIGILLTCIGCALIRICAVDVLGLVHTKKTPDFFADLMATTSEYGFTIIPWTL